MTIALNALWAAWNPRSAPIWKRTRSRFVAGYGHGLSSETSHVGQPGVLTTLTPLPSGRCGPWCWDHRRSCRKLRYGMDELEDGFIVAE